MIVQFRPKLRSEHPETATPPLVMLARVNRLRSPWYIQGLLVNYKHCVTFHSHSTFQRLFAALSKYADWSKGKCFFIYY